MEVKQQVENKELTLKLTGSLDTESAPDVEDIIEGKIAAVESILFDFYNLEYVSSAGLRVLLDTQKTMNETNKSMKIVGANEVIMEVFEMTGFIDIMDVEEA